MVDERTPQEMAKALYPFKGTNPKTLSFNEGEYFLIYHPSTKEKNWWQVINSKAQTGYVPSNYVVAELVTGEFLANWLDKTIEILESTPNRTLEREELLIRLKKRRYRLDEIPGSNCEISRAPSLASIPPAPESSKPMEKVKIDNSDFGQMHGKRDKKIRLCTDDTNLIEHNWKKNETDSAVDSVYPESFRKPLKKVETETFSSSSAEDQGVSVKKRIAELGGTLKFKKHSQSDAKIYEVEVNSSSNAIATNAANVITNISPPPPPLAEPAKSIKMNGQTGSPSSLRKLEDKSSRLPQTSNNPIEALQEMRRRSSVQILEELQSRRLSEVVTKEITEESVYHIIEEVRNHTGLSYDGSRVAVMVVLSELEAYMPRTPIFESIARTLEVPLRMSTPLLENTHDAQRLNVIFNELISCKEDSQQRSWMLHEDEKVILDYVEELISILMNADATVCTHVISRNSYSGVQALADYYQMEVRWRIRKQLLTAFSILCGLDRTVITLFMNSVLPCELSRDMMANPMNINKLSCSALLLTVIFSMGDVMPYTHHEQIGDKFFSFILGFIEQPPSSDVDDVIPNIFSTLVLSINLQFQVLHENKIVQTLGARSGAKAFTERILVLFNREEDPVRIVEHKPEPPNSVLKILIDLFGCALTANLFYTNDVKVLIDIVVRQLTDLSPGDNRRLQYLNLCRVVLRTNSFSEHQHRREDLFKTFTRILLEEGDVSILDQKLVREIFNEFPQYLMF